MNRKSEIFRTKGHLVIFDLNLLYAMEEEILFSESAGYFFKKFIYSSGELFVTNVGVKWRKENETFSLVRQLLLTDYNKEYSINLKYNEILKAETDEKYHIHLTLHSKDGKVHKLTFFDPVKTDLVLELIRSRMN